MMRESSLSKRESSSSRASRLLGVFVLVISSMSSAKAADSILLADPKLPLAQTWTHQRFIGETDYQTTILDGVPAIRAIGRNSASGLYRDVNYRIFAYPWLEWMWRTERLQRTADIRVKDREDFAAAVFLIFGRPSLLNRDVPTLAYVWTGDHPAVGSIVDSTHHPGVVRYLVVRGGADNLGRWMHERRNVMDDFRRAFGRDPPQLVQVIALFTDNDQTRESVESYYGRVRALRE